MAAMKRYGLSLFVVCLAPLLLHGSPTLAGAKPSFFNSQETLSTNLTPFKKWTSALARYSKETAEQGKGDCQATNLNKCHYEKWNAFLDGLKGKDALIVVHEINTRMNKAKYITDNSNWGVKDYWESPGEFMSRFGDCEDYAIIKFLSLMKLGFTDEQLRVVAVKDMNLKVGHAILVVFLDGKTYVLDNQIKQVVEAATIRHYQPVFSINNSTWWRHRI